MWTLYGNPKTKNSIFNIENVDRIRELFAGYNYVQSLQVIEVLPSLKTQIVQQNLPYNIERLQCVFIESFCIAVLAVFELSKSLSAKKRSPNEVFFFKRRVKQAHQVEQHILDKAAQLRFQILQQCNLKAIKRSQKANEARCVVPSQKNFDVCRLFRAFPFTNRVLQRVIL